MLPPYLVGLLGVLFTYFGHTLLKINYYHHFLLRLSLNAVDKKCYSVKHTIQYTRVNTA